MMSKAASNYEGIRVRTIEEHAKETVDSILEGGRPQNVLHALIEARDGTPKRNYARTLGQLGATCDMKLSQIEVDLITLEGAGYVMSINGQSGPEYILAAPRQPEQSVHNLGHLATQG
jgi:hypothetical protein